MRIEDRLFSPLVSALVENPANVPDVYLVTGLLGRSYRPGYVRLYLLPSDADPPGPAPFLDEWIDIHESIVRFGLAQDPSPTIPSGWNALFIDATAAAAIRSPVLDRDGNSVDPTKIEPAEEIEPESTTPEPTVPTATRPKKGADTEPEGGEPPKGPITKVPRRRRGKRWPGW